MEVGRIGRERRGSEERIGASDRPTGRRGSE